MLKPFRHQDNRTALDWAHKITIQHSLQGTNAATKELHRTATKGKVTQPTKELHNAAKKEQCNTVHERAIQRSHKENYNAAHAGAQRKQVTHQAVSKQNRPARTTRVWQRRTQSPQARGGLIRFGGKSTYIAQCMARRQPRYPINFCQ